jgi:hypothetical protein
MSVPLISDKEDWQMDGPVQNPLMLGDERRAVAVRAGCFYD